MAQNIAVRRAAKAQRRKAIVAQKRKAEIDTNSTAGQVRLASTVPIQYCLLSEGLFGTGMGMLVVARGATPYNVTMATFLLDTFALGVKDVFLRSLGGQDFAAHMDRMSLLTPMSEVDPAYARKLLRDLTAWSYRQGFNPHPGYAKIEPIFGTTDPDGCDAAFEFGDGGKPLVIGDLSEAAWGSIELDDDEDAIDCDGLDDAMLLEGAGESAPRAEAD
jgi:hypothetical protein